MTGGGQMEQNMIHILNQIPYDPKQGYCLLPGYAMYRPNGSYQGVSQEGDYLVNAREETFSTPHQPPQPGYTQEWISGAVYDGQGPATTKIYILAEAVTTDVYPE